MPVYYRTFPGNIPDSRSVETILTDISHAGFPRVILVTDRGYESVQNLEKYILRGQPMIMCVKMRQKIVLDRIAEFGTIGGKPGDMLFDTESRLYYKQLHFRPPLQNSRSASSSFSRSRSTNDLSPRGREPCSPLCRNPLLDPRNQRRGL